MTYYVNNQQQTDQNDTFVPQNEEQGNHAQHHFITAVDHDVRKNNLNEDGTTNPTKACTPPDNQAQEKRSSPNTSVSVNSSIINIKDEAQSPDHAKTQSSSSIKSNQVAPTSTQSISAASVGIVRKGKWSQEEEEFVDQLIKEFEAGTIVCTNGTTLRSFLAKRLNCSGMRISKKFAGKNKGNLMFLGRPNVTKGDSDKLSKLEEKYVQSILRENHATALALNHINAQRNAQGMQAIAMQQALYAAATQAGSVGVLSSAVNLPICNFPPFVTMNGNGLPISVPGTLNWNTLPGNSSPFPTTSTLAHNVPVKPSVVPLHQHVQGSNFQSSSIHGNGNAATIFPKTVNVNAQSLLNSTIKEQQRQTSNKSNLMGDNSGYMSMNQQYNQLSNDNLVETKILPTTNSSLTSITSPYTSSAIDEWKLSSNSSIKKDPASPSSGHFPSIISDGNKFVKQLGVVATSSGVTNEETTKENSSSWRGKNSFSHSSDSNVENDLSSMLELNPSIPSFAVNGDFNNAITADSYAEFAQQSTHDVSQHSAYRHESLVFPYSLPRSDVTMEPSNRISNNFNLSPERKRFKTSSIEETTPNTSSHRQQAVLVSASERSSERSSNSGSGNGSENGSDDVPSSDDVQSGEEEEANATTKSHSIDNKAEALQHVNEMGFKNTGSQ